MPPHYVLIDSADSHGAANIGSTVATKLTRPIHAPTSVEVVTFTAPNDFVNIRKGANTFFVCLRARTTSADSDATGVLIGNQNHIISTDGTTTLSDYITQGILPALGDIQAGTIIPIVIEPGSYTMKTLVEKINYLLRSQVFQQQTPGNDNTPGAVTFELDTNSYRVSVTSTVFPTLSNGAPSDLDAFLAMDITDERLYRNSVLYRMGFAYSQVSRLADMITAVKDSTHILVDGTGFGASVGSNPLTGANVHYENHGRLFLKSDLVSGHMQQTLTGSNGYAMPTDILQTIPIDVGRYSHIQFESNGYNAVRHPLQSNRAVTHFTLSLTDEYGEPFADGEYRHYQALLKFDTLSDDSTRGHDVLTDHNRKRAFLSRHSTR